MTQEDKEQFKQDIEMLIELAFDGMCISKSDEQLIKRVKQLAEKI